jgi:branched-chain amino acid transport system substrate-binding protein
MNRRHLLQSVAALTGAGSLSSFADVPRIVLGQSAPFSGPSQDLGEQFKAGAMLAFDAINQRGGVHGRHIELRSLDDGDDPERCATNTKRLIDDGAQALFGYVGTRTTLAAVPVLTAAKVPLVAPLTGADALHAPFNRYLFHIRASYNDEAAEIAKQIVSVGTRRVAVFFQNDAYGQADLSALTSALRQHDLTPVSQGMVERHSDNVIAPLHAVMAGKPDCIVQMAAHRSCAAFIRGARRSGYRGSFYSFSFVDSQALATDLRKDAGGVVVSQVVPFPFQGLTPLAGDYLQRARAAKAEASYTGMEGFIAARTMVEGLRHAGGDPTPASIVAGLEAQGQLDLGGFFISFSNQRHAGSRYVDMTILTDDGKVMR